MNTKWSIEQRQEFLKNLNAIDRILVSGYRLLLGLVIAAITSVVVLVIIWRPWGAGNQGEWVYFSVAVLFALGWAVGQLIRLDRRQKRQNSLATFHAATSENKDGTRAWNITFGPDVADPEQTTTSRGADLQLNWSQSFEIPLASLSTQFLPDHRALACFAAEMKRGTHIDEACRLIQPAFADWNRFEQDAYRRYVTNALNQ